MSDTPKSTDPRTERLKAALRDNLRRRKAQSRERSRSDPAGLPGDATVPPEPAPDSDPPDEPG